MGYSVSIDKMDEILGALQEKYRVYAPKLGAKRRRDSAPVVRYGLVKSMSEIVFDKHSDFSPKEVFYPIMQTLYNIKENEYEESRLEDDKGLIIFARPCDINGMRRLDTIFLENGGNEDLFYKRRRERVKIFMIECLEGWDNCFCVSMGSNIAEDYEAAFRIGAEGLLADVKDAEFREYFSDCPETAFVPEYISENKKKLTVPDINSGDVERIHGLDMWKQYNDSCISCGACNTVCITCSCFDTTDIIYNETSRSGERRRVWSGCMLENFTTMAGGHNVRGTAGERMRFKVLHKVYDFKKRFGQEHMCVGCGRCDSVCPEDISYFEAVRLLGENLKKGED